MAAVAESITTKKSDVVQSAENDPDQTQLHPLQDTWVMFVRRDERSASISWKESIEKICQIDSIEMYWSIMEKIYPASLLSSGCDQMIFKDGIFPSAEDPPNNTGCYVELRVNFRSLLQSQPEQKISRKAPKDKVCQLLDTLWQRVNIIFLGCTNPELDHAITGIMLQVKAAQNFRYQIWTNTEERETISSLVDYLNSHLDEVAKEAGCVCNYKFRNNQHRKYV